jgi:WD40 repeat protein
VLEEKPVPVRMRLLIAVVCIISGAIVLLILGLGGVLGSKESPPALLSREKISRLPVTSVDWSPTGVLAAGTEDRTVRIWRPLEVPSAVLTDFDGSVADVRWDTTGRRLAIASNEPTRQLRIWDSVSGQMRDLRMPNNQALITSLAWSSDGSTFAVGTINQPSGASGGGSVLMYDVVAGQLTRSLTVPNAIAAIAWSVSGQRIAAGTSSRNLVVPDVRIWAWEIPSETPFFQAMGKEQVDSLSWSPDGNRLAAGKIDGNIEIWDPLQGVLLHSMHVAGPTTRRGALSPVEGLEWSPNGNLLATGSWDNYLRIWDSSNFALNSEYINPDYVNDLSWSPDGKAVVAGSANGEVLIWTFP